MTHAITLIADHKGNTKPKVSGDEYFVDAAIDITAYTQNGEVISASDLGLSTVNCVIVTGVEEETHSARAVVTAETGAYASTSTFAILLNVGSSEQSGTANEGTVRVRVYGNL